MRSVSYLAAMAILVVAIPALMAGHGHHGKSRGFRSVKCPACHNTCRLSVTEDEETKHCYQAPCETICIPRVVFPWQKKRCGKGCGCAEGCGAGGHCSSAVNRGAKTRRVRVLKKYEYECPRCKYTWSPAGKCYDGWCGDAFPAPEPAPNPSAALFRAHAKHVAKHAPAWRSDGTNLP
jgi:hypothetical protein